MLDLGYVRPYQASKGHELWPRILGGEYRHLSREPSPVADNSRDGVTEDQNPIIARHPQHSNLLVAGGASYTYAKDLPDIGGAIVDTLNGNGRASFGWDQSLAQEGGHNQPALRSRFNFEELEREASQNIKVKHSRETTSQYLI